VETLEALQAFGQQVKKMPQPSVQADPVLRGQTGYWGKAVKFRANPKVAVTGQAAWQAPPLVQVQKLLLRSGSDFI
jgi:hypothetical protein